MRKSRRISVLVCALLAVCLLFGACAPGSISPGGDGGGDETGETEVVTRDWKRTSGVWKIQDNVFYQTGESGEGRLVYQNQVNQEYATLSVDVKLPNEAAWAGIEFRATGDAVGASDLSRTWFTMDGGGNALLRMPSGEFTARGSKKTAVKTAEWHTLSLTLNGTEVSYYVDNVLVESRSDVALKVGNHYIALIAEGSDVRFKNVTVSTYTPNKLSWEALLDESDLVKSGYDRYSATHFEYPYIGFGRTSLLVSAYGFLTPKASRPSFIGSAYRDDPQLIYDLWWDDAVKVDPFTFSGGYEVNGKFAEGEMLDDGVCTYRQTVEIDSGKLITALKLKVGDGYVSTTREMFVNEDGVVIIKVKSDTDKPFLFNLTTRSAQFGDLRYDEKEGGYLASCWLRKDQTNRAYVRVKAVSEAGFDVRSDGTIAFAATDQPVYLYLAPESDLSFEEGHDAAASAEEILTAAVGSGYEAEYAEMREWYENFYSVSQISVPDLAMAKWYVRSLFYHAVSMAGTRVPPGCYANQVGGFFGGPCPEFDLTLSQYALMYTNHTDLAQTTIDWYGNVKDKMRELAENGYEDKTGHKLDPTVPGGYLIPWIASWDGSPTHGDEVGHEQGWVSNFAGANVASFILSQAQYTNGDLSFAKDIMMGQLRVMMSFFVRDGSGKWVHKGVWAGGSNYSAGSFSESMAAVWSIVTVDRMRRENPELFTAAELAGIDEWVSRLPDMPPYGGTHTVTYDPDKAMYTIGHTLGNITEMITEGTGFVGGPTNNMYLWYGLLPYDDGNLPGTLVSIAESGQFDYHFNTGWSATVAARAGLAEFAYTYTRNMLRPTSLYDDWYFTENVNDSEDFKRSPELGAHGAYIMAMSAMLFDGETDTYIKAFPAIDRFWQSCGADFDRMLAKGNILVSGSYTDEQTTVVLENRSDLDAVRDVYIRVREGSGAGMAGGKEYPLTDGCMIVLKDVEIPAGQTVTLSASGIEKEVAVGEFQALSPVAGSDRVRLNNVPFSWTRSANAAHYELIVSEYADLRYPIFDQNVGSTTLYYPLDAAKQINLEKGKTYYWTVYGVNGDSRTQMSQGVMSFKAKGETADRVEPLPDGSVVNAFGKTWSVNHYAVAEEDGLRVTNIAGYQENDPTGAWFETDRDFTITVTVSTDGLGKIGIEMFYNGSYQFVRTESGCVSSYGNLAAGGISPDANVRVEGPVTYRMSRINNRLTTYYKMAGDEAFTEIMSGELSAALNGQTVRIYLCAIANYSDQNTPVTGLFTDYTETFYEVETPGEEDEIPSGTAVAAGETVTMDGITFTAGERASKTEDSLIVGSLEGHSESDPTGFYFSAKQNFVFTARLRTADLGRCGVLVTDPAGKYLFIRMDVGVLASYGSIRDGVGSGNYGVVNGWVSFRISLVNNRLTTAYSADGETWTDCVDISVAYTGDDAFKIWLYAAQYGTDDVTNAVQFTDLKLETSEFEQPEELVGEGETVSVSGVAFTANSAVKKVNAEVIVTGDGRNDDNPAGLSVSFAGDFVLTAKLKPTLNGAAYGLYFLSSAGYSFLRISGTATMACYGNINTGESGRGDTQIESVGDAIWMRATRIGNTIACEYSLDGVRFTAFNTLVLNDSALAAGEALRAVIGATGNGVMTVQEVSVGSPSRVAVQDGETVDVFGNEFHAFLNGPAGGGSAVKGDSGCEIAVTGGDENFPVGFYLEKSGNFTMTIRLKLSAGAGSAGLYFTPQSADGKYFFARITGNSSLESYGTMVASGGVGGTDIGYTGGEITLRITRNGNTVKVEYSLDGIDFTTFADLVLEDTAPETLRIYVGGARGTAENPAKCEILSCTIE